MKLVKLFTLLTVTASSTVAAQEHRACNSLDYHYEAHASDQLRTIAASCKSKLVANLFYNRAYHADLVSEATALAGLIAYSDNNSRVHFEAYRLYMSYLEQMAKVWYPDSAARVRFLNREYDSRVEIEGLRLRGYDHVADYLERSFITP